MKPLCLNSLQKVTVFSCMSGEDKKGGIKESCQGCRRHERSELALYRVSVAALCPPGLMQKEKAGAHSVRSLIAFAAVWEVK